VASRLTGPFQLLYVLHTSRTDAELGRYESPELTKRRSRSRFLGPVRWISFRGRASRSLGSVARR
jgi:hypothetical protein